MSQSYRILHDSTVKVNICIGYIYVFSKYLCNAIKISIVQPIHNSESILKCKKVNHI